MEQSKKIRSMIINVINMFRHSYEPQFVISYGWFGEELRNFGVFNLTYREGWNNIEEKRGLMDAFAKIYGWAEFFNNTYYIVERFYLILMTLREMNVSQKEYAIFLKYFIKLFGFAYRVYYYKLFVPMDVEIELPEYKEINTRITGERQHDILLPKDFDIFCRQDEIDCHNGIFNLSDRSRLHWLYHISRYHGLEELGEIIRERETYCSILFYDMEMSRNIVLTGKIYQDGLRYYENDISEKLQMAIDIDNVDLVKYLLGCIKIKMMEIFTKKILPGMIITRNILSYSREEIIWMLILNPRMSTIRSGLMAYGNMILGMFRHMGYIKGNRCREYLALEYPELAYLEMSSTNPLFRNIRVVNVMPSEYLLRSDGKKSILSLYLGTGLVEYPDNILKRVLDD